MCLTNAIVIILVILIVANLLMPHLITKKKNDSRGGDNLHVDSDRVLSLKTIPVKLDKSQAQQEQNLTYIDLLNASVKIEKSDVDSPADDTDKDLLALVDSALGSQPSSISKQCVSFSDSSSQEAEISSFVTQKLQLNNGARRDAQHNTVRDGFH